MDLQPQAALGYRPENIIAEIADFLGDPVKAAQFPETILRFRNDRAARTVGLDALDDPAWLAHFGRFAAIDGSLPQPLALRYHGHQFRNYNPDIGDGRGFLFAQLREQAEAGGRLLDLGTKGSGQTPYSRFGDGRLTLKGGVREILATEMLEALGVPTSRTFSIIETGEALERHDEPSPTRGAAMVRLSHGHIRIGSFQRLFTIEDPDNLRRLVDYSLRHMYQVEPEADAPLDLYRRVVARCADLAASYMTAGFVHGVLNTDNIAITGESFDYGPWRFAPRWDERFTAAYFDHQGLYAFGRQAEAIHWNLAQLAIALVDISDEEAIVAAFHSFTDQFHARLDKRMLWRLGLATDDGLLARKLTGAVVSAMGASGVNFDRFFFDWRGGRAVDDTRYAGEQWSDLGTLVAQCMPVAEALDHAYWRGLEPCSMLIEEVEAIWAAIAEHDDWSPLHAKVEVIREMGAAHGAPPHGLP